jgi:hypothetical protein
MRGGTRLARDMGRSERYQRADDDANHYGRAPEQGQCRVRVRAASQRAEGRASTGWYGMEALRIIEAVRERAG